MTSPSVNGPNGDGSKSLAKESKAGLAVSFIAVILADAAIGALTNINLSSAPGWSVQILTAAAATALGLLTAWRKKNK